MKEHVRKQYVVSVLDFKNLVDRYNGCIRVVSKDLNYAELYKLDKTDSYYDLIAEWKGNTKRPPWVG